jgi:hypothetical protein
MACKRDVFMYNTKTDMSGSLNVPSMLSEDIDKVN